MVSRAVDLSSSRDSRWQRAWPRVRCWLGWHPWDYQHLMGYPDTGYDDVANYRACQRPACRVAHFWSQWHQTWIEGEKVTA